MALPVEVTGTIGAMTSTEPDAPRKRRRVVAVQRWVLNPPMKLLVWLGLVPGHVLIETRGRRTGRRRRTVVGAHHDASAVWVIAEQGRHAAWVRNLEAQPDVRVRRRARWRAAQATVIDGDDSRVRMASWRRRGHARLVQALGTELTTVRVDLKDPCR